MVDVGDIRAELSLIYSQFKSALKSVEKMSRKTGRTLESVLGTTLSKNLKATDKAMTAAFGSKTQKNIKDTAGALGTVGSKTYGFLKDIKRIAAGILLSQVLYRGILQPIQEAVKELKDFIIQMEQTELAFEMMLGGARAGQAFVDAMEDFAAVTPFVMEDTTRLARYLLGVGFSAKSIIPILTRVTDAMALMGTDPAKLTRLVEALGKIKAYGGATLREIKSIARTGLPIVEILQEQLGLTTAQVRNIAKLAIPADIVIEAILAGIQKRFAGGAARLQRTIGGLMSTISDNMLLISKDIFTGITEIAQSSITLIADRLEVLRRIIREGGVGALFEEIIPEDLHETLRLVVANLQTIGREIATLFRALGPFIIEFLRLNAVLSSLLLPIFLQITGVISTLLNVISSNTQAVKIFIGVLMGMMIAQTIAKAFHMLNTAMIAVYVTMKIIMTSNWIGWVGLAIGALAAWALSTEWVQKKLQGLQRTIADIFGFETGSVLQPIIDSEEDILDIVVGMGDIADGIEDVGSAAEDAAKEVDKILASFDEVYDITEKKAKEGKLDIGLDLSGFGAGMNLDEGIRTGIRTVEELMTGVVDGIRRGRGYKRTMEMLDDIMVPSLERSDFKEQWEKYSDAMGSIWWVKAWRGALGWVQSIDWEATWKAVDDGLKWVHKKVMESLDWFNEEIMQRNIGADWEIIWNKIKEWGIWDWFKNIENWAIWKWFRDTLEGWTVWDPENWIGLWKGIEQWSTVWEWLKGIKDWEIWDWFENKLANFSVWKAEWMKDFKDGFLAAWEGIAEGMKTPLNSIIGFINTIISAVEMGLNAILSGLRSIRIPIPDWAQKFVDGMTEFSIPVPDSVSLGRITQLGTGGIINKDQLIRVGERGEPEMVQPLNKASMKPFADMLASLISGGQTTNDADYVMVRANKQDLTNLYRQLFTIQKNETVRGLS